jgi:energy-coupling factor transporter transmembrane protein EcfT
MSFYSSRKGMRKLGSGITTSRPRDSVIHDLDPRTKLAGAFSHLLAICFCS